MCTKKEPTAADPETPIVANPAPIPAPINGAANPAVNPMIKPPPEVR